LHRVYAVIQGGNKASRRCFEKVHIPPNYVVEPRPPS
jgi:hypothetical protein